SSGAAASATVAGSPYAISVGAADGTGLANYDITYVAGSLTVNQKALTITALNQAKDWKSVFSFDTTSPSTHFTVAGLVNDDAVDSVSLSSSGAAASATVAGSPYAISVGAADGTGLANYDITYVAGSLTVNQKALTITALNQA